MATVIFVHGTGVRQAAYEASLARIAGALKERDLSLVVNRCCWGEPYGARLNKGGASIPQYDTTRSLGGGWNATPVPDVEYEVALWGLLYEDPLGELRVLALRSEMGTERPPGRLPGDVLAEQLRQFIPSDDLSEKLREVGLDSVFDAARWEITHSPVCRDALSAAPAALGEYRAAIARAIVAQAIAQAEAEGAYGALAMDGALRDEIVQLLIDHLGGGERSLTGWVKGQLLGWLMHRMANQARRRRGALTDVAYPAAGDVLLYQARGDGIRGAIRESILKATAPVVVLAHSLGSIASVDLLVTEPLPVDLLITMGSQVSFLYEIDALYSLRFGAPLPDHFPPNWLNFYDLRDLLSYPAEGLFPGRVRDVQVDNRQPFPEAHSAYWGNRAVWDTIGASLP